MWITSPASRGRWGQELWSTIPRQYPRMPARQGFSSFARALRPGRNVFRMGTWCLSRHRTADRITRLLARRGLGAVLPASARSSLMLLRDDDGAQGHGDPWATCVFVHSDTVVGIARPAVANTRAETCLPGSVRCTRSNHGTTALGQQCCRQIALAAAGADVSQRVEQLHVDHATKRSRRKTSEGRKCAGLADGSGNSGWQAARNAQRSDGPSHLGAARTRVGTIRTCIYGRGLTRAPMFRVKKAINASLCACISPADGNVFHMNTHCWARDTWLGGREAVPKPKGWLACLPGCTSTNRIMCLSARDRRRGGGGKANDAALLSHRQAIPEYGLSHASACLAWSS